VSLKKALELFGKDWESPAWRKEEARSLQDGKTPDMA
jgi:hypothetical protein